MTFAQKQVKIVMRILVNITYRHNAHYVLLLSQVHRELPHREAEEEIR